MCLFRVHVGVGTQTLHSTAFTPIHRQLVITRWHGDRAHLDLCTRSGKGINQNLGNRSGYAGTNIRLIQADDDGFIGWLQARKIGRHWRVSAIGILRVITGNGLQHPRCILNTSGHWANMIQTIRQRKCTVETDSAIGWFQTDQAIACRGKTNTAAGI